MTEGFAKDLCLYAWLSVLNVVPCPCNNDIESSVDTFSKLK